MLVCSSAVHMDMASKLLTLTFKLTCGFSLSLVCNYTATHHVPCPCHITTSTLAHWHVQYCETNIPTQALLTRDDRQAELGMLAKEPSPRLCHNQID